ncbi:ABC-three component system protein [Nocardia sp. NPDC058705]|uniref:ABC-three component system protein n=1 Tax=Nocardia sp. NPDC058705 TaxID=3346609 RepID=UPI0036A106ED
MAYPYEDLDDSQFERLVVQCSRKLFGAGVQSFSTGPDGGRDARFEGAAERFPSAASPWTGITVIQAKHTNAMNVHYSDPDFSGETKSSVLTEEIIRIKKLADDSEVSNYILFSNRRLGANASASIVKRISEGSGLERKSIFLAGVEYLNDLLREFVDIISLARIDPIDGPLLLSSYDLAEVILAIRDGLSAASASSDAHVVERVSYESKNKVNNMSADFAGRLRKLYLPYSMQIGNFLADPGNAEALRQYEGAVEEFQLKIVSKRRNYQTFDELFNYLVDFLLKRDAVLARNARLVRTMLFYMYWHCDIGESADAATQ